MSISTFLCAALTLSAVPGADAGNTFPLLALLLLCVLRGKVTGN